MTKKYILTDVPMPIRTERLVIFPMLPEHAEALYHAKLESIDHLRPWIAWAAETGSLDDQKEMIIRKYAEFVLREEMMLLAFTHEGEFVVATGFHDIDWRVPRASIGYWCRKSAVGNGYVTETANALIRYGFEVLGFRKIIINMDSENTASENVALRLNLTKEYEELGGLVTLHEGGLRTKRSYCCFDTSRLPPLDVTWGKA